MWLNLKSVIKKPIFWILSIGLGLRLISLNQSLWLDEAIQTWASKLSLGQFFWEYLPTDFNPPLSYLITHVWGRLFGWSEISLRLPSVIFGCLSIYLVYLIAQEILAKKSLKLGGWDLDMAEVASLMLAVSGLHIYYSQEARPYSLACFLVLLSFYCLLKKKWLGLVMALVLASYSHYLVWLLLPVFFYQLFKHKQYKALLIILCLVFPWLAMMKRQLTTAAVLTGQYQTWRQVLGGLSLKNVALVPVKFILGRISLDNKLLYGLLVILVLAPILVLLKTAWQKRNQKINLVWQWLLVPLGLGLALALKLPLFNYFRFLFILPVWYLLIVFGLSQLKQKPALLLLELVLAISLLSSSAYLVLPRFHREDWRQAVEQLNQRNQQFAPVLIISNLKAPFLYYDQEANKLVAYQQVELVLDESFVWLVKYGQPIFDPDNQTERLLLSQGFKPIYEANFNQVGIKKLINLNLANGAGE